MEQARARCCLALAAIDQSAVDAGSWTLAQEYLLELPPPYGSFVQRRPIDPSEQQATRLVRRQSLPRGDDVEIEGSRQLPREQEEVECIQQSQIPTRRRRRSSKRSEDSKGCAKDEAEAGPPWEAGGRKLRIKRRARARGAVRAPGSLASTCMPGIWKTCFEVVKSLRSGLSSLLHSIFRVSASRKRARPGRLWPMPLPFPEVHLQRFRGDSEEGQVKLGVNFMVLVLDWLAMDEKLTEVGHLALGVKQNAQQWEVTHRLVSLVKAWNNNAPVSSEAMGRSAAKVESIEEVIRALVQPARELRSYLGKVFSGKPKNWGQLGHPGFVIGQLHGGVDHVAKDVEPERYKFYGRPEFEASEYLDEENRDRYLHPLDYAEPADPDDPSLPRVKVRGSRENQLRLLEVLDKSGRLALLTSGEVERGFENGMFSIPKDAEKDRMVLDARRPNSSLSSVGSTR